MSKLRIKLLVASVSAFVAADVASAQVVTFGGGRGVVGSPGVVVGNPGLVVGTPGGGGWNSVNLGRGVGIDFGSPYVVNPAVPYQSNYSRGGWNQPAVYGTNQPLLDRTGRVVYTANPTYSAGPNVVYSSGQPAIYAPMPATGFSRSGGFTAPQQQLGGVIQTGGFTVPQQQMGGVIQTGGFTVPQQQMGGLIQTGAMAMPQTGMDSGLIASAQVLAPDGARVTLNGTTADREHGPRPFISPPLDPNKTYTYRAKATWTDGDGREKTREKRKDVRAGEQVVIDLTREDQFEKPAVNDRDRDE